MLGIDDLPCDELGWPAGVYTLHVGTLTDDYPDAHFRKGVAERVPGRAVARLHQSFGGAMKIAPSDAATAELCARRVFERTGDGAKAKALRALFAVPKVKSEVGDGDRNRRRRNRGEPG